MNKIFKVKRNSLGQSVVCSEIATSRSKGRVVASALALSVLASATATQAFAQNTDSSLEPESIHELIDKHFKDPRTTINTADHKEYLRLLYKVAVDHEEGIEALTEIVGAVDADLEDFSEWAYRTQDNIINIAEDVKANQSVIDALKQTDTYLASIAGTNQGNIAKLQTEVGTIGADLKKKADQEQVNTLGNKVDALDTKINTLQSGHQNLDGKINRLDKDLSAGIAGSVALAMMPAPAAGSQYITGGTGFYNGESAVALGFTGASETGKFTYKLGGSLTSSGSGTFGAGAGYRWK